MRIVILYASAGHGHFQAALAAREGFLASGVPESEVSVRDALEDTPAWFRNFYTSSYYYSVKHTPNGWGNAYSLMDKERFYRAIGVRGRRLVNDWVAKDLVLRIEKEKPDAILCTHFLAPEVLGRAKERGVFSSLLATVVTDFIPHRFWINPGTDHYWVMSEEGHETLIKRGVPPQKITAGGIPVALRFRSDDKKVEFRKKEGLEAGKFTLLITSGSFGLGPTEAVLRVLREFSNRIQAIVVCGKNQVLFKILEGQAYPFRMRLYGFVSHMDELMEASDLLIAKPGGATTAESLAKGVPMVVLDPIPGQEAGNANLLRARNAAFFMGKPEDIRTVLKGILDFPSVLEEKKKSIQRLGKPDASLHLARLVLDRLKNAA